jgi:HSP20 family protein
LSAEGATIRPDTDVFVNNDDLVIVADMPGVAKGDVVIEIDEDNVVSISAKNVYTEPDAPVLRQFETGNYYRAFQISDEYDNDKVAAVIDTGVLRVTISRKESAKPRKIEISA